MDWSDESAWEFAGFYNNLIEEVWSADGFDKEFKRACKSLIASLPKVGDLKVVRQDGTDDIAFVIACPRHNTWIIDGIEYTPGPALMERIYQL